MDNEKVVLMLPVVEGETKDDSFYPSSGLASSGLEMLPISYETLVDFTKQFTNFELDSLEINVKGVVKSGGLTQLIVGLEGEAAMTVVLKKKE
ncbi:hypothetical protein M3589_15375 [Heyndrickxia oleronia]|uniref:hypothetical protein n=1 Tax=Heyndrickxia oleronia TaxID=38875 RepID=UPI00204155BD|nr:hypothetical protein [Heyndrickxia oleronia]MCM3239103.1 hypothetical protein [Heyndrickxia oleronia]